MTRSEVIMKYINLTSIEADKMQEYVVSKNNQFIKCSFYYLSPIEHKILANNLLYEEAMRLENEKIKEYNSYDKQYGYNIKVIK